MTTEKKLYDALMVLLYDWVIVEHLKANDPMAMHQAHEAVTEYLMKNEPKGESK